MPPTSQRVQRPKCISGGPCRFLLQLSAASQSRSRHRWKQQSTKESSWGPRSSLWDLQKVNLEAPWSYLESWNVKNKLAFCDVNKSRNCASDFNLLCTYLLYPESHFFQLLFYNIITISHRSTRWVINVTLNNYPLLSGLNQQVLHSRTYQHFTISRKI